MFTGIPEEIANAEHNDDAAYERLRATIDEHRATWWAQLKSGQQEIMDALKARDYAVVLADNPGDVDVKEGGAVILARVKNTDAIIAKMQRYGESLANMLDVFGYRVVVFAEPDLDRVVGVLRYLWEMPSAAELLLRHGTMQFEWMRDYRKRTHAGLSSATSLQYDQAVHVNRRHPSFGICEVQVMTLDLYRRAFTQVGADESHSNFEVRRAEHLAKK